MALATLGVALALAGPSMAATYDVGAATRDITPTGIVNLGGFGLGDGHADPGRDRRPRRPGRGDERADRARARSSSTTARTSAIAIADIETQGMFAAYEDGPYGLHDIAQTVAERTSRQLPADHILIASDHTHSGPDTIGAWGGVSDEYLAAHPRPDRRRDRGRVRARAARRTCAPATPTPPT